MTGDLDAQDDSEASPGAHVLCLEETLDLNAASELAKSLQALRGTPIVVDPSRVGRVGAQCIQVLVGASKSWAADGVPFSLSDGSDSFDEGLTLLGLTTFFSNESSH